ncbi:MAG TPA: ornithine carbamoyltransferase [Desulfonauticus sp.]|jgi:ornithine carbamoyltransferase|nr:MAG: Ornithine carbamoyltransferase, catabolic [Desulfonauticus sp. 38_4375]MDK2922524.1 ornithine carbamoyltransferase [Desulfonauticus sp.]HCO11722.1 ornithine carbamoyltransferase [Desulfonauticus sp.]
MRHFLSILDLKVQEAQDLVKRALEMKTTDYRSDLLAGKVLALIFEKSSTRTRVSFEVGISHLGGKTIFMTPRDCQLGRSEPLQDTARVLSRYVQGLVVRTFEQEKLELLASFSSIPIINALTDLYHPCQVMSDLLTIYERTPDFSQLKIAWIGDGNNMAHSWINAAIYFPFQLNIATPKKYAPDGDILARALSMGAKVYCTDDPKEAVEDVDYVNTDVWASMGQEEEAEIRKKIFAPYQVNKELLSRAKKEVKVMHCLPAHRGEEITEDVLESEMSIVWDQAENRLHMQKAILELLFS